MATLRLRPFLGALSVALSPVLVTTACGGDDSGSSSATDDGTPSLDSVGLTPLGNAPKLRLGEPSDLPTVVNVWATWCVPCRKEMPAFEQVARELDGKVRFVGVNLGDSEEAASAFVAETGVTFDQYRDPDMDVQAALSVVGMPSTALLRADGTLAELHSGALDEAALRSVISKELDVS